MRRNADGSALRNITSYFRLARLGDETTETAEVHILALTQAILDDLHVRLNNRTDSGFVKSCSDSDFVY